MKFIFSLKNKIAFYWTYFVAKVFRIWFEVKRPKLKMFAYEMLYSLMKFRYPSYMLPSSFSTDYVETIFGKFTVRPRTVDMALISPAFERTDLLYLLDQLKELTEEKKKILFLDIGAYIGKFSITVGNRFRDYGNLDIIAFELVTPNYRILERNIILNDLKSKIEIYNAALYDEDGKSISFEFVPDTAFATRLDPSMNGDKSITVMTKTLNTLIGEKAKAYDAIVMKIDVEGAETEVLEGGHRLLKSGAEVHLVVEDFANPKVVPYLEESGAMFVTKVSPYNSWWKW